MVINSHFLCIITVQKIFYSNAAHQMVCNTNHVFKDFFHFITLFILLQVIFKCIGYLSVMVDVLYRKHYDFYAQSPDMLLNNLRKRHYFTVHISLFVRKIYHISYHTFGRAVYKLYIFVLSS